MQTTGEQAAFYCLNAVGGIGLMILSFTTLLSRNAKKHPALLNLYFTCIFEAYLACLLLFADLYTRKDGGMLIPRTKAGSSLCVAQAVLFTPTPVLLAGAAFGLVFHVFLAVYSLSGRTVFAGPAITPVLMALPYVLYTATSVPIIIAAAKNQLAAKPYLLYCYLDLPFVSYLVGIITAAIIMISLALQVWTVLLLKRDYARILGKTVYDIPLLLRAGLFTVYMVMTFALSVQAVADFTAVVPDLLVSTIPIVVLIIFGSHRDVISAWKSAFMSIIPPLSLRWINVAPTQSDEALA